MPAHPPKSLPTHRSIRGIGLCLFLAAAIAGTARAELPGFVKTDATSADFFEKRVRPVLVQQCYKCHSSTAEKVKGGLYLDSRAAMLKGGTTGPAIVPGHPEKSLLIEAIKYTNTDMQMPPKTRLSEAEVADLTRWVQLGATWPGSSSVAVRPGSGSTGLHNLAGVDYEKLKHDHWAWQPIKNAPAPAVKDAAWPRTEIDKFVLAPMEAAGLHPVADADRTTLLRRLSFDLAGLPPTPAELEAFLADTSPTAVEQVVDRLLASPQFGERWGRHWLDVARYAESTGSTRNVPYPAAWRYRDYVIAAFNKDMPYDRFITEQIAGDLMPYDSATKHNEQLIATGFLAMGVKDLNEKDRAKYEMDNIDEQIDVVSRSVLGLTVACARCHDHKFDPIPTAEYYSMAGIFKSSDILSGVKAKKGAAGKDYAAPTELIRLDASAAPAPVAIRPTTQPIDPAVRGQLQTLTAKLNKARAELHTIQTQTVNPNAGGRVKKLAERLKTDSEEAKQTEITSLTSQIAALQPNSSPVPPAAQGISSGETAIGVKDDATPANARICVHGDADNLGAEVPRGVVSILRVAHPPTIDRNHSGRLQLAQTLVSPSNPLTARVMANRVWQHLFGEGLVRTSDNFGTTGEAPSHLLLLDHLATQFVHDGWSVKKLIRSIVLTRAYQLAGTYDEANAAVDPGDRLIWRMAPRRLEAESLRDAMLAAAGSLNVAPAIGSPVMNMPVAQMGGKNKRIPAAGESGPLAHHRSIYLPIIRGYVPEVLDVFDFAEPAMVTGNRDVTTVSTQALYLMNNSFVIDQAKSLATRVLTQPAKDDAARVDLAYKLAFSRPAKPAEQERALQYIGGFTMEAPTTKNGDPAKEDAWASLCQAMFESAEFRYVR